jgi:hypothetical protein
MVTEESKMSTTQETKKLAPLHDVLRVEVSERRGKEINVHCFWMAREFVMILACGHTQTRVKNAYSDMDRVIASLPSRTRCNDCTPITVVVHPRNAKSLPEHNPVAVALAQALVRSDPAEEKFADEWVRTNGGYIFDDHMRARSQGTLALKVIDHYASEENAHPKIFDVREAVQEWVDQPTPAKRTAVSRAARSLYGSQKRRGEWYSNRGVIAAASATGTPTRAASALIEALTWDATTRSARYAELWSLRYALDSTASLSIDDPSSPSLISLANQQEEDLRKAVNSEVKVAAHHKQLILDLMALLENTLQGDSEG